MRPQPLVPRWIIRRLYAPFRPDVEQELRVQRYLYGRRTQVEVLRGRPGVIGPPGEFGVANRLGGVGEVGHVYRDLGENLLALDRCSHERLHRGEDDPHP